MYLFVISNYSLKECTLDRSRSTCSEVEVGGRFFWERAGVGAGVGGGWLFCRKVKIKRKMTGKRQKRKLQVFAIF